MITAPFVTAIAGTPSTDALHPQRGRGLLRLLEPGATAAIAGFVTLAVTAAVLDEFEVVRVNATVHRPFVLALAGSAVVAAAAAWARFRRDGGSQATFVVWAFGALAGVYSPHALLESGGPDPRHLMYGPASRLLFAVLLLGAVARIRLPESVRRPSRTLAIAGVVVLAIDVLLHSDLVTDWYAANPRAVLRGVEWSALGFELACLVGIGVRWRREHAAFLASLGRLTAVMFVASSLFLLSEPWSLRWWVAHLGLTVAALVLISAIVAERVRRGHLAGVLALDAASSVADVVVEEMRDGLALMDDRGRLIGWNPAAMRLTGWDPDEAARLFPPHALEGVVTLGNTQVRARQFGLRSHGRPVRATVFSDASEEAALRTENERLELIAEQAEALEAAVEAKNELIGMAAHDLRSPLSAVHGFAQVLQSRISDRLDDTERLVLDRIESSSARMLRLVNDMLGFSAVEAGGLRLHLEEVDLVVVVAAAVRAEHPAAAAKGIRLHTDLPGAPAVATVDAEKVDQVVANLVSNAVKYSPPDTVVTVGVRCEDDEAVLWVADRGQGIPAGELDRLFQPFGKTSVKPTGDEGSTGLGLAIVKKIVEGHGGTVGVTSTLGRGSRFTASFPLVVADRDAVVG